MRSSKVQEMGFEIGEQKNYESAEFSRRAATVLELAEMLRAYPASLSEAEEMGKRVLAGRKGRIATGT